MKELLFGITTLCLLFVSCKNTDSEVPGSPRLTNCDGLTTDTAGTNDNARIYMPSAFTSNGDGKNDIIKPTFRNVSSFSYTLYDFNNTVVFATTQLAQGWTAPSIGSNAFSTYYYKIQVTTSANRKIGICGPVYNLSCYPSSIPRADIHFEDELTPNGFTGTTTEVLPNCR